jgi:aspartate/methionine/tyrosine aminotransferase
MDDTSPYEADPAGLLSAREAVCAYYAERGVTISAEQVVLTASTSEAYATAFRLLCDPGDTVLVPRPSYPLFDALASAEGVSLAPYALGTVPPVGDARAIVVVNPNHPTGTFATREEAAELRQTGLPLIVDEVFADFPYFGGRPVTTLETSFLRSRPGALELVFSGLSKVCGLPHAKLGWIVVRGSDFDVGSALERLHWLADTFLSVGQPVQRALPGLLAERARFQGAVRARVARNRGALLKAVESLPDVSLLPMDAGWTGIVVLGDQRSDEEWALALLEHDVIVHPGYFYGFDEPGRLVVSLLPPPRVFDAAVAALFSVALG